MPGADPRAETDPDALAHDGVFDAMPNPQLAAGGLLQNLHRAPVGVTKQPAFPVGLTGTDRAKDDVSWSPCPECHRSTGRRSTTT